MTTTTARRKKKKSRIKLLEIFGNRFHKNLWITYIYVKINTSISNFLTYPKARHQLQRWKRAHAAHQIRPWYMQKREGESVWKGSIVWSETNVVKKCARDRITIELSVMRQHNTLVVLESCHEIKNNYHFHFQFVWNKYIVFVHKKSFATLVYFYPGAWHILNIEKYWKYWKYWKSIFSMLSNVNKASV
jgi:hypothetical protein